MSTAPAESVPPIPGFDGGRLAFLSPAERIRAWISRAAVLLALFVLAGTFWLMSPPVDQPYPGSIPWDDAGGMRGLARTVFGWMSLNHRLAGIRGVEVKEQVLYWGCAAALALFAVRAAVSGLRPSVRATPWRGPWFFSQVFLLGWVGLSFASMMWSSDSSIALGQAAIYGLCLAWAISLGWCVEARHITRALAGYCFIAAIGACLCIAYYYLRNPFHRPGFPIGNPGPLAACILPAITICAFVVLATCIERFKRPSEAPVAASRAAAVPPACHLPALLALIPLCWCFYLAGSRGAWVGLLLGLALLLLLLSRRRIRFGLLLGIGAAIIVIFAFFSAYTQDVAMARGATVRFRVYAWQYAGMLWRYRPISGLGAGAYPQHSGRVGTTDRALDPAAFMGDSVEHAHNELFEVFVEIGLVGGVTFVAGYLATVLAAASVLRANLSSLRWWMLAGLIAGILSLMIDGMFGVALRLPGAPAVFFTLVGLLWAADRTMGKSREASDRATAGSAPASDRAGIRWSVSALASVLALAAALAAYRNGGGHAANVAAVDALRLGDLSAAAQFYDTASTSLLDPVQKLTAAERRTHCLYQAARGLAARARPASMPDSAPAVDAATAQPLDRAAQAEAAQFARLAFDAATALTARAPGFGRPGIVAAQSAELLAQLSAEDSGQVSYWLNQAATAWAQQRLLRPYDSTTLLALARYVQNSRSMGDYLGLLRDALRSGGMSREWFAALTRGSGIEGFSAAMEALLQSVSSYTPDSDLDALAISGAPEMLRLAAAWNVLNQNPARAADLASRAVAMYRPLQRRFPLLYPVALKEQAEYLFRSDPSNPGPSIELLETAIRAVPVEQLQVFRERVQPYAAALARYLLAADRDADAAGRMQDLLGIGPDAAADLLRPIREALLREFPAASRRSDGSD